MLEHVIYVDNITRSKSNKVNTDEVCVRDQRKQPKQTEKQANNNMSPNISTRAKK